jgi:hypothetical protein
LVLDWPMAAFDQLSDLSLRLVGDVRIDKGRGHRRVTIGEKYVDGNGGSCALAAPAKKIPMTATAHQTA